ncbi:hypothetical protein Strvi_0155 (plasmid) [Streptomyces violaceusniger Tu 4113]|uniref:Uncharacterized protein n=1 Tax=Streptomyces violaceusniger (strain Tu 4113) TaxID=653045 RepID=G2PHX9_STRV4|nr:hypothetical protein Strvi_0155 [Streptomyces violaceusniger Tu 4113]
MPVQAEAPDDTPVQTPGADWAGDAIRAAARVPGPDFEAALARLGDLVDPSNYFNMALLAYLERIRLTVERSAAEGAETAREAANESAAQHSALSDRVSAVEGRLDHLNALVKALQEDVRAVGDMGAATSEQVEILAAATKYTTTRAVTAWRSGHSDAPDNQAPNQEAEYAQ